MAELTSLLFDHSASHVAGVDRLTSIQLNLDVAATYGQIKADLTWLGSATESKRSRPKPPTVKPGELLEDWDLV